MNILKVFCNIPEVYIRTILVVSAWLDDIISAWLDDMISAWLDDMRSAWLDDIISAWLDDIISAWLDNMFRKFYGTQVSMTQQSGNF